MHNHQNGKQDGQVEMDITPFVTGHRPEVSYLFLAAAAAKPATASTGAGGQDILHNKTGANHAEQSDEAD
jgi:hypothetical protein